MKLKRILAAALCLLVVAAILPTAAFAAGARNFTIAFKTADEAGAGTDGYVWVEIWYDDEGKDIYRNENYLDNKGDDFERGETDYYTFSIPDRPIKHVKIEYKDCGWKLEYVEFGGERFDKFERSGDGYLYDGSFVLDVGTGKIADARLFTIGFKTAYEKDAGTDADVWVEIWYDDEGKDIYRRKDCLDNPGNDFEMGELDYYTFEIPNRPIKHVKIEYKDAGWKLDYVEFDDVLYFRPENEWLMKDDYFIIDVTEETQIPDGTVMLTFCTGNWDEGGTDNDIYLTFYYKDRDSGEIEEETRTVTTKDDILFTDVYSSLFEANQIDSVVLRGLPTGKELISVKMYLATSGIAPGWDLEWVRINQGEIIQCHWTFNYYDDELMVFPGVEMVDKTLEISVGDDGTDDAVMAKFLFKDGTESGFYRLPTLKKEFELYKKDIRIPNKPVASITIRTLYSAPSFNSWYLEYMNFDDKRYDAQYPFTKEKREHTFYPGGSEPSNAGSVFGDANMGVIIGVGAAVIVIAAAAVIVGVRKKKNTQEEM